MKKFILPLLLLLAIGMLAAVESDPSDVVGYIKVAPGFDIQPGGWYPISIPFAYTVEGLNVNQVIGTQLSADDYIEDIESGDNTSFNGTIWEGGLEYFDYGRAYWLNHAAGNPTETLYLMGKVDPQPISVNIVGTGMGGWTILSLNECQEITLNGTGAQTGQILFEGASEGDYIEDLESGDNASFNGSEWEGGLEFLTPTHVYWYNSTNASGWVWNYDPADPWKTAGSKSFQRTNQAVRVK
ncbi:MAG: hypothetical protein PHH43_00850 [Candidatus Cloacimonetes bacterium]|nr:hypothetical protein [Candidatus Cloacimonadota bacterium]